MSAAAPLFLRGSVKKSINHMCIKLTCPAFGAYHGHDRICGKGQENYERKASKRFAHFEALLAAPEKRRRSRLQGDSGVQRRLDGHQEFRLYHVIHSDVGDVSAHRFRLRTQPERSHVAVYHYERDRRDKDPVH